MLDTESSKFAFASEETYTDQQLIDAAKRVVSVYVKIGNKAFNTDLPMPIVNFNLCETEPTWGGGACYTENTIYVNMILFKDNIKDILNQTIPHEVAHMFQRHIFDRKGAHTSAHGVEWQEIMLKLGKDPFKYHQMDVSKSKAWYKDFKKEQKRQEKEKEKMVKKAVEILSGI